MKKTVLLTVVLTMVFSVGTAWAQLPPGWTGAEINESGGSSSESGGVWTVTAEGADIWGTADQFHYCYTTLDGDGFIEARILAPGFSGGNNEWAKAGVMIRESTDTNSTHSFMANTRNTTESHFFSFQGRPTTGAESVNADNNIHNGTYPNWVRLERTGNTFEGFVSLDGVAWTSIGTQTHAMQSSVLMGLAVTSHQDGTLTTVKFDSLDYTGMQKEAPVVDAGDDQSIILPATNVSLSGEVFDNGEPLPTNPGSPSPTDPNKLRWDWSMVSSPSGSSPVLSGATTGEAFTYAGSPNPPNTVFSTTPTLTVDLPGLYTVKLNATDSTNPGYNDTNDTVLIKVYPVGYDGKVAHYEFEEPSGTVAADSSGVLVFTTDPPSRIYNDGTHRYQASSSNLTFLPVFDPNRVVGPNFNNVPGLISPTDFGTAVLFDGDSRQNFVDLGDNADAFDITDEITIACWVKLVQWNRGWQTIIAKGDNSWRLSRNSHGSPPPSNNSAIAMHLSGITTDTRGLIPVDDGEWHHIAGTYDGTAITSYVDGVVDTVFPTSGQISVSDFSVYIAENSQYYADDNNARGRYFWGAIDDMQIFHVAKTQDEIVAIAKFDNTKPVADAGPDLRLAETPGGLSITIADAQAIDVPGVVNIKWTVVGPGGVTFDDDTLENPTVTFTTGAYGLYIFTMEVEDGLITGDPDWTDTDTMGIMFQGQETYGVLGMWTLDDGAGTTAADSSGNGYHGTLTGAKYDPNWTTGKIAGGLEFINNGNGWESDQAVLLDAVPVGGDLTASFWMNADVVDNKVPIDKLPNTGTAGWNVKLRNQDGNAEIWFQVGSEANHTFVQATGNQYAAGEWVYVTVTFDSATGTGVVYVNGLEEARLSDITHSADSIATPLRLGTPSEAQIGEQFPGKLDHVRVQDRALTQLEVARMAVADMVAMEDCILSIPGVPIPGDLNADCYVDLRDFGIMASNWLECTDLNDPGCDFDFNP